jgi:Zn-finger domain-containing protein
LRIRYGHTVVHEHPLKVIKRWNTELNDEYTSYSHALISYQEITEDEYNEFGHDFETRDIIYNI